MREKINSTFRLTQTHFFMTLLSRLHYPFYLAFAKNCDPQSTKNGINPAQACLFFAAKRL
jgi:hypothetical protein